MILSESTLRKVRLGHMILCMCGRAHHGKYEKCTTCLTNKCEKCDKPFIKGGKKICAACLRKRSNSKSL